MLVCAKAPMRSVTNMPTTTPVLFIVCASSNSVFRLREIIVKKAKRGIISVEDDEK
jgi:hypothetical protein